MSIACSLCDSLLLLLLCLHQNAQAVTCEDVSPVKAPGQAFTCPSNREFDPSKATVRGPSVEACCSKVCTTCARCFYIGWHLSSWCCERKHTL